jgi:myo-inositol-1(or 4)-monophosphatase
MAAGIVILREAGGIVSGFTMGEFSLYGQELVATNGHIHDQLLDALHQRPERP